MYRFHFLFSVVGKAWNLPNSLLGMLWGLAGVVLGGERPVRGNNGINFPEHPLMPLGRAVTLGNVMVYGRGAFYPAIRRHEQQHTVQGEILGPLYLPLHLLDKLIHRSWGPKGWLERGPYAHPPRPWPWK